MTTVRRGHPGPTLSLAAFSAYLSKAGWTLQDADQRTTMWQRFALVDGDERDVRVVLPLREDVTDYEAFQDRALRAIAFAEQRAIADVEAEIRFGPVDVMAVRLVPGSPSGQAPLTLARDALDGLRGLVIGSASGLSHPAYAVPPTYRPAAERFANTVRVSTSRGSFIVTMSVPLSTPSPDGVETAGEDAPRFDDDEDLEVEVAPPAAATSTPSASDEMPGSPPFGRLVVVRMRRVIEHSVELAQLVVAGDAAVDAFEEAPAATGNALELQALAEIGGPGARAYTVRFAYSPTVAEEFHSPTPIRVVPDVVRVFEAASDRLRTPKPVANVTVVGRVVGLSRGRQSQVGEIILDGRHGETKARKYRARLSSNEYDLAVRAHRRGLDVSVTGDVTLRGHQYVIEPVRTINVSSGLENEE